MSLPAGYRDWAQRQGCSVDHPDEWSDGDRTSFYAWKLDLFKVKMAGFKAFDMPAILRGQLGVTAGNERIRETVREALERLKAPPPSRPWRTCSCHPFAPVKAKPEPEMPHGLLYLDSFRRRRGRG